MDELIKQDFISQYANWATIDPSVQDQLTKNIRDPNMVKSTWDFFYNAHKLPISFDDEVKKRQTTQTTLTTESQQNLTNAIQNQVLTTSTDITGYGTATYVPPKTTTTLCLLIFVAIVLYLKQ